MHEEDDLITNPLSNPLANWEDDEPCFAAYPPTDDLEGVPLDEEDFERPTMSAVEISIAAIAEHSMHLAIVCQYGVDRHDPSIFDVILHADDLILQRDVSFETPLPAHTRQHIEALRTTVEEAITRYYAPEEV